MLSGATATNNNFIQIFDENGGTNQKFKVIKRNKNEITVNGTTVPGTFYVLNSALDTDSKLWNIDMQKGGTANMTLNIQLYQANNGTKDNYLNDNQASNLTVAQQFCLQDRTGYKGEEDKLTVTNTKKTGNLIISKKDYDYKDENVKAAFKLKQGEKYVRLNDLNTLPEGAALDSVVSSRSVKINDFKLTDEINEGTTIIVNNGSLELTDIYTGTYTLEEIETEYGYTTDKKYIYWNKNEDDPTKASKASTKDITFEVDRISSTTTDTKIYIYNKKQTGNLVIRKRDYDVVTTKLKDPVQFRLKKDGAYVKLNEETTLTGTNLVTSQTAVTDVAQATTLSTSEGQVVLVNLQIGTYEVEEVSVGTANFGYDVDAEHIYWNTSTKDTKNSAATSPITIKVTRKTSDKTKDTSITTASVLYIYNQKQTGSIQIEKKDKDSNVALSGIQFRLKKDGEYIRLNDADTITGTARITAQTGTTSVKKATKLITDTNGKIKLVNLLVGDYELEEIDVGINYYGYTIKGRTTLIDGDYIYVNGEKVGNSGGKAKPITLKVDRKASKDTSTTTSTKVDTTSVFNQRKYVKVSGNVWEDVREGGKSNEAPNNLLLDNDIKLQGIKVTLKDTAGNTVTKPSDKSTFKNPTTTDSNGSYYFDDVIIDNLDKYYIEFEYDGVIYTTAKSFNELPDKGTKYTASKAPANTSKAQEEASARSTVDNNYSEVTGKTELKSGKTTGHVNGGNFDINYKSTLSDGNSDAYSVTNNVNRFNTTTLSSDGRVRNVNQFKSFENYNKNVTNANTKANGYGVLGGKTKDNIRKKNIEEITDINCGLTQREQVNLSVAVDLENIKVTINGYSSTYLYGKSNDSSKYKATKDEAGNVIQGPEDAFRLDVKAEKWGYLRQMYASDIVYTGEDGLKAFMTYSLTVRNNSNTLDAEVTKLANYHSASYTIVETGRGIDAKGNITNKVENAWETGSTVQYTKKNVIPKIGKQSSQKIYVKYELSNSAIKKILEGDVTLNNVIEIGGYTTYYGADTYYHTSGKKGSIYASIDSNSAPENAVATNNKTYEDDTMAAPKLTMQLTEDKNERTVEGNVFEDVAKMEGTPTASGVYTGQERIGDGKWDSSKEGTIEKVKVELYKYKKETVADEDAIFAENTGDLAKLWTKADSTGKDAITYTDTNGQYKLTGIIPDKYVLKFTYGNGNVIYKKGTKVKDLKNAEEYKSTIITSDIVKEELKKTPKEPSMWYSKIESDAQYSVAIDNKEAYERGNVPRLINRSKLKAESTIDSKSACSAPMELKIESSDVDIIDSEKASTYTIKNMNFGIIEKTKKDYSMLKEIVNIKIILANGQILVDGNPASKDLPYMKYLTSYRSNNTNIEIDNELIMGATLEITYKITAKNESEVNYLTPKYYYFGEDKTNQEKIAFTKIIDYLDYDLVLDRTSVESNKTDNKTEILIGKVGTDKITIEGSSDSIELKEILDDSVINSNSLKDKKGNVLILKDTEEIAPEVGKNEVVWKYKASKVLANADDLEFGNDGEVVEIKSTTPISSKNIMGNYVPETAWIKETVESTYKDENDYYGSYTTITNPTGENRSYSIYIIIGVASVILIGGIIIIKRKVL